MGDAVTPDGRPLKEIETALAKLPTDPTVTLSIREEPPLCMAIAVGAAESVKSDGVLGYDPQPKAPTSNKRHAWGASLIMNSSSQLLGLNPQ